MTEELIKEATAKLALEKGFIDSSNSNTFPHFSTQTLLQKWLRETHFILVSAEYECISSDDYEWGYRIIYEEGNAKRESERLKRIESVQMYSGGYLNKAYPATTYEGVLEMGLLEALKLIKDEGKV